jgi:hypothetical protein
MKFEGPQVSNDKRVDRMSSIKKYVKIQKIFRNIRFLVLSAITAGCSGTFILNQEDKKSEHEDKSDVLSLDDIPSAFDALPKDIQERLDASDINRDIFQDLGEVTEPGDSLEDQGLADSSPADTEPDINPTDVERQLDKGPEVIEAETKGDTELFRDKETDISIQRDITPPSDFTATSDINPCSNDLDGNLCAEVREDTGSDDTIGAPEIVSQDTQFIEVQTDVPADIIEESDVPEFATYDLSDNNDMFQDMTMDISPDIYPDILPSQELAVCDHVDNDGDGLIDEINPVTDPDLWNYTQNSRDNCGGCVDDPIPGGVRCLDVGGYCAGGLCRVKK